MSVYSRSFPRACFRSISRAGSRGFAQISAAFVGLLGAAGLVAAISISAHSSSASELGAQGNLEAKTLFESYRSTPPACDPTAPGKRVLLTGFGLFQGATLNPSGAIVANVADPTVWPEMHAANQLIPVLAGAKLQNGQYATPNGARAFTRALEIDQLKLNVCVLVLDVMWDVAGAIVAYEMDRFQPQAVLMLGAGPWGILEGGARNQTSTLHGFRPDGAPALANVPQSTYTLPAEPSNTELPMRWDTHALEASIAPLMAATFIYPDYPTSWRPGNDYICNQISYIALSAAANHPIRLAGGLIELAPKIQTNPQVGFFHVPSSLSLSNGTIGTWGSLVTSLLYFMSQ